MLIPYPNDGTGLEYHVVDLYNRTVHAYRCRQAALRSLEGDQRIVVVSRGARNPLIVETES
jgi:hypothetical protein